MQLRFSKMHGLGNDFVVIDAMQQCFDPTPAQCRWLADRRFGIGCDQILLVQPPQDPAADFYYRIFNSDGSEVAQCGNGARCFARFVHEHKLSHKSVLAVDTQAGRLRLFLEVDGQVRVNMGLPRFDPPAIPFLATEVAVRYSLTVAGTDYSMGVVSLGNPHAVLQVTDLELAPLAELGPALERHAAFPQRVNVGFMQVLDPGQIRLRVYERGVGETLACGSGACAAAIVGQRWGLLTTQVRVNLLGGVLQIRWDGPEQPVWMTGPAVRVFDGEITL